MTISISFWEIALLIIAIAFVFLVAALVRFFNNLKGVLFRSEEALTKVNILIEDNKDDVKKLINNSTEITSDIQTVVKSVLSITSVIKRVSSVFGSKK